MKGPGSLPDPFVLFGIGEIRRQISGVITIWFPRRLAKNLSKSSSLSKRNDTCVLQRSAIFVFAVTVPLAQNSPSYLDDRISARWQYSCDAHAYS